MHLVVTADPQGVPIAFVSSQHLWDLVEFLAAQRLAVHYSYHGQHFAVRFPRMTVAAAQQTLDEWAHAHDRVAA